MISKKLEKVYLSQSSTFNSDAIDIESFYSTSLHSAMTNGDTIAATLILQVSNDLTKPWIDLPATAITISDVETDYSFIDIQCSSAYVRASVTIESGSADFEFAWFFKSN
jgi:hypothetical protein